MKEAELALQPVVLVVARPLQDLLDFVLNKLLVQFLLLPARPAALRTAASLFHDYPRDLLLLNGRKVLLLDLDQGLAGDSGGGDGVSLRGHVSTGPAHSSHGTRRLGARCRGGEAVGRVRDVVRAVCQLRVFLG